MRRLFLLCLMITINTFIFGYTDISQDWLLKMNGRSEKIDLPFYNRNSVGKMVIEKEINFDKKEPIFIFLGRIDDEDRVFFNNYEIGSAPVKWYGKYNFKSFFYMECLCLVPENIMKIGENTIRVEITNYFGGGGFHGKKFYIYSQNEFGDYYNKEISSKLNLDEIPYFIMAGIFFAIFIKSGLDYLLYKPEKENIYYSLLMFLFSIYSIIAIPQREKIIPLSSYYISKLDFTVMILILTTAILFIHEFFRLKYNKIKYVVVVINLLTITSIFFVKDIIDCYFIFNLWIGLLILHLIFYIGYLKIVSKNSEKILIKLALIIWFGAVLYDILYFYRVIDLFGTYISMYGEFIFAILLIITMTDKYYKLKRKLDEDSKKLEYEIEKNKIILEDTNNMLAISQEELAMKEEQLIKSEKFAILGEMAGEITHEIKNPLSAILTNVQVMKMDMELFPDGDIKKDMVDSLEIIEEASKQAKNVIANILNYARMESAEFKPVDLIQIVQSAINILKKDIEKSRIELRTDFEEGVTVEGRIGELTQVVLNLIINSKDAIVEGYHSGAVIKIRIYKDINDYGILEIEDNGKGMSAEEKTRIFEPYFTTKENGKGTGLGMSISYNILKRHKAEIVVESEELVGTKFIIKFKPV